MYIAEERIPHGAPTLEIISMILLLLQINCRSDRRVETLTHNLTLVQSMIPNLRTRSQIDVFLIDRAALMTLNISAFVKF